MTDRRQALKITRRIGAVIFVGVLAFAISYTLLKDGERDRTRSVELAMAVERAQLIALATATARDLAAAQSRRAEIRTRLEKIATRLAARAPKNARQTTLDQLLRAFVARLRGLTVGGDRPIAANDPKLVGVLSVGGGSLVANYYRQVTELVRAHDLQRATSRNIVAILIVLSLAILAAVLLLRVSPRPVRDIQGPALADPTERNLSEALAGIAEGVALFGPGDALIFSTPRFSEIYRGIFEPEPGIGFEAFARAVALAGGGPEDGSQIGHAPPVGQDSPIGQDKDADTRLAERLARHQTPHGPLKEYLNDGRCLEVSEYATAQGGTIVLVRDITQAERREAVRVLNDARTGAIVDTVFDGIIMINDEGIVETFNPAAAAIFGYDGQEVIGENVSILMPKNYAQAHDGYIDRYLRGGQASVLGNIRELEGQRKDGSVFPLEIAVNEVDATWILQERRIRPRRVFIATLRDVTQQKELARQLQQSQKMEAIGTLAGGIAHDFNNILSIILGYTGLTLDHVHIDDETEENLGMILEAANRARSLVDQILTFSRRGEQQRIPVDMQSILEDGLRLLRSSLPSTVEIRKEIGPGPFSVMADPTQMHQVLMNLCTNAGQAMEAGGILEVKLDHAARAGTTLGTTPGASLGEVAGRDVRIVVRDTGVGMDAETMERVFEPFYTTKAPGVGIGLGLSVVHGIVSDHGGSIVVKSAAGAGATFTVLLPVGEAGTVDVAVEPSPIPTGEGRILFVDDEPAVVRMGEKLLGRLGYEVICETSSPEALRRFRSDPDQFDLVVTDQTMPDMTGEVLAQEIRRIRHDIPVIVCTGFSKTFTRERARELGIDGYVMKPSLATDLGQVVHDVLRDRAASG